MERINARSGLRNCGVLLSAVCLVTATASGATSYNAYTGTLASPTTAFETSFTLSSFDNIQIQTWGFGGGTNAAGQFIPAGGFDPLVTLFSGLPATATIVTDASSNPLVDADNLSNPPYSFVGNCLPAGYVTIGTGIGSLVCGDDLLKTSLGFAGLPAGTYTLVLTDANYQPAAIFDNGALSEGFNDLTGGVFQTCNTTSNGTTCVVDSANYAVDIVSADGKSDLSQVPEPTALALLGTGLAALAGLKRFRKRRMLPRWLAAGGTSRATRVCIE